MPLAPRVTSVTSVANDKGDNEMILGAVHRSPGICLTAEQNPIKPSDEGAVRPVIASNGVHFLQMRSVGSHSTSGREKEGNKERAGGGFFCSCHNANFNNVYTVNIIRENKGFKSVPIQLKFR